MKKSTINETGSIILFIGSLVFSMWVILQYAPQDEHVTFQKESIPEYNYSPVWYEYPSGAWGTLSHDPTTGRRGKQIDSARIETLKLAE